MRESTLHDQRGQSYGKENVFKTLENDSCPGEISYLDTCFAQSRCDNEEQTMI